MENLWEYADGLFQSKEPVLVPSVGGKYDVWYDVSGKKAPTSKQIAAWGEFCGLRADAFKQQFILALNTFADQMSLLCKEEMPKLGPSYSPQIMRDAAHETAAFLHCTNQPLGEISSSVFIFNSLVIPSQEDAPCHFVLMNFEVKSGKVPGQTYGCEMEALFCDGQLLLIGENSGLWTRLEWKNEFNRADFDKKKACSPFWR